jgi:tryptophan synthase alpha chain
MKNNSNLDKIFQTLESKNEIALIPYLTAGYPSLTRTVELIEQFAACGADIIEIGLPFSDPVADGPAIQYASHQALLNGVTVRAVIKRLKKIKVQVPLIIMSYANPILAYGREKFFYDISQANITGVIVPDLPIEESQGWRSIARNNDIAMVFLVAPTSSPARIRNIARLSQGFIYCVSLTGTTGVRKDLAPDLLTWIKHLRRRTNKPIAVGFGISSARHIRMLRNHVDGVIMGSRIMQGLKKKENLERLIKNAKKATRR